MKDKFLEFLINQPKKSLIGFCLSLLLFVPGILMVKEDFTYSVWYNNGDYLMELFKGFQKRFGNDDQAIISIYNEDGVFNEGDFKLLSDITDDMLTLPDVVRVETLSNANLIEATEDELKITPLNELQRDYSDIKELALLDEGILGVSTNEKGSFATMAITVRADFKSVPDYYSITEQINEKLKKYEDKNIKFYRAGSVILTYWFKQITLDDMNRDSVFSAIWRR